MKNRRKYNELIRFNGRFISPVRNKKPDPQQNRALHLIGTKKNAIHPTMRTNGIFTYSENRLLNDHFFRDEAAFTCQTNKVDTFRQ